jgi:hypothetical protein
MASVLLHLECILPLSVIHSATPAAPDIMGILSELLDSMLVGLAASSYLFNQGLTLGWDFV